MTKPIRPLDQFKDVAPGHLPGLLVFFDLADTKRRNCHLGHAIVDNDIEEFDRLLRLSIGDSGVAMRVRGDSWLAIYSKGLADSLPPLLDTYQQQQEIQIGWRTTARRDGDSKVAERKVLATITRGVRCLYSNIENSQELNGLIEELFDVYHTVPPNIATLMSQRGIHEEKKWRCISNYPTESPFCPFCERTDFDWEDGDGSVYSGSGTCKHCGADIDIRGVEEF